MSVLWVLDFGAWNLVLGTIDNPRHPFEQNLRLDK